MIGFVEKSSKKAALACYQFERFVFFLFSRLVPVLAEGSQGCVCPSHKGVNICFD